MTNQKLEVKKRKLFGRKVKKLRQEGILPANIYGKNIKSQAVKVELKDFMETFKQTGETGIIELKLGANTKPRLTLIHNIQRDPVSDKPLHVDFHQVDLKQKVQVNIPVELKNIAPAISKGGVLIQVLNEIEVECLPNDLPEKFTIDTGVLKEIGQTITIKEVKTDKEKIKILLDDNQQIIRIEKPKEEEEPEEKKEPEEEKEQIESEEKTEEENKKVKKEDKTEQNNLKPSEDKQ